LDTNFFTKNYIKGDSFIHKMNSILKLFIVSIFSILVFTSKDLKLMGLYLVIVLFFAHVVGMRTKNYLKILKLSKIFIYFSFFTSLLKPSYPYYFKFLLFTISERNLMNGLTTSLRILILIFSFQIFFASTNPMTLISKLKSLRTNTRIKKLGFINLSFILILSLHFIPIIIEEFKKARQETLIAKKFVQKDNFVSGLKNYNTILPAVFLSTLEKAESISKNIDESSYETFFEKTLNQE